MQPEDFEDKYQVVKPLGTGGYSQVFLVTDYDGDQYALKKIDKKGENFNRELLFRQIHIMQALRQKWNKQTSSRKSSEDLSTSESSLILNGSRFVAKIYDWEQTDTDFNLLLEYCNGGDLRREMSRYKPNFVFPLDEARKIIADILRGLEFIHGHGFVHRDIKLENILVKNEVNTQKKVYKIGDFGISKDVSTCRTKTVLGTRQYMSPEMLAGRDYRFQVDMWALGVLLYMMLNMSYPFRIIFSKTELNPMVDDWRELSNTLIKLSKNFSYKESVKRCKNTRKQPSTCTKQMESLFQRIFEPNPEKRLTFIEIREHPVFAQFFRKERNCLKKIYQENYIKKSDNKPSPGGEIFFKVQKGVPTIIQYQRQYRALVNKNSEIEILMHMHYEVKQMKVLSGIQKLCLAYNLLKFYLIRKQKFLKAVESKQICSYYPKLKMKDFSESKTYKKLIDRISQLIPSAESRILDIQSLCFQNLEEIAKVDQYFYQNLQEDVKVSEFYKLDFDGNFKLSYRKATSRAYCLLQKQYNNQPTQKTIYLITMTLICHHFNRIFQDLKQVQYIFGNILSYKSVKLEGLEDLEFQKLKNWLFEAPQGILFDISSKCIKAVQN